MIVSLHPHPARLFRAWVGELLAAAGYGLSLLAVGWVLGPIRVLWIVPHFGPLKAVLIEGPIILSCAAVIALGLLRQGWIGTTRLDRLRFGVVGAAIALLGELVTAAVLWGMTAALASLETGAGRMGLALIAAAALIPLAPPVGRERTGRRRMAR